MSMITPVSILLAESALLKAGTAAEAAQILAGSLDSMRPEDRVGIFTDLHGALAPDEPALAVMMAEAPDPRRKVETLAQLEGARWDRIQTGLVPLFTARSNMRMIVEGHLEERGRRRDELQGMVTLGKDAASFLEEWWTAAVNPKNPQRPNHVQRANFREWLDRLTHAEWDTASTGAFALGFNSRPLMKTLLEAGLSRTPLPRRVAEKGKLLLLTHALREKDPDFATWFLTDMHPESESAFFEGLADLLCRFDGLSRRLIVSGERRDLESLERRRNELMALRDPVNAIYYALYVEGRDSPAADNFYSRLKRLTDAKPREIFDRIQGRIRATAGSSLIGLDEAPAEIISPS